MRAVAMHRDAADILCIDIAANVTPAVNHEHLFAIFLRHLRKRRTEQPCADNQIIILHLPLPPV